MASQNVIQFPEKLVVVLVEEESSQPVADVFVGLKLRAVHKNDYHFAPRLSDASGEIIIEREWVVRSIAETVNFFTMDYASTLDDCYPTVSIIVNSVDDIKRAIAASELYGKVGKVGELGFMLSISDLKRASNYKYEPQTVEVTLDTPNQNLRELIIRMRERDKR